MVHPRAPLCNDGFVQRQPGQTTFFLTPLVKLRSCPTTSPWSSGVCFRSKIWGSQVLDFFPAFRMKVALLLDTKFCQTCNTAELQAAVWALEIFGCGSILCANSQYILLGATSATKHWKSKGWVADPNSPIMGEALG